MSTTAQGLLAIIVLADLFLLYGMFKQAFTLHPDTNTH